MVVEFIETLVLHGDVCHEVVSNLQQNYEIASGKHRPPNDGKMVCMKQNILIVTNGYKETWSAIEQGAWLAKNLEADITLLGVTENLNPAAIDDHHPLEDVFEKAVSLFDAEGLAYKLEVQNGSAEEVIPMKAKEKESIVVLSPLGRNQIKRFIAGRSIRHFMEEIEQPILYVPQTRLPVKKILTCMGGLGYEVTAEHLAVKIAMKSRAEITLLHIAPPVDLDYPTSRAIRDHWQTPEDTDTPIGRSLRQALEIAKADGDHQRFALHQK